MFTWFVSLVDPVAPISCAFANGMYRSGGLLPCGTLTMPMILKFVPPMSTVEPVFSLFAVA